MMILCRTTSYDCGCLLFPSPNIPWVALLLALPTMINTACIILTGIYWVRWGKVEKREGPKVYITSSCFEETRQVALRNKSLLEVYYHICVHEVLKSETCKKTKLHECLSWFRICSVFSLDLCILMINQHRNKHWQVTWFWIKSPTGFDKRCLFETVQGSQRLSRCLVVCTEAQCCGVWLLTEASP